MAYADGVRRELDHWLNTIEEMANETHGIHFMLRREQSVNTATGNLFDNVAVTGLLFCIAQDMPGMETTDLWEGPPMEQSA